MSKLGRATLLLLLFTQLGSATPAHAAIRIEVLPGDELQTLVDANPPGTVYWIRSGVHRHQQVWPKDGDSFIGELGAVLSGAKVLTGWVEQAPYWTLGGQTARGQVHGVCAAGREGCRFPEDLYVDNQPLHHQISLELLDSPDEWFFDYDSGTVYILFDPSDVTVELGVTRHAFAGSARDVTIAGLTIEKYASPAQHGAIQGLDGIDWIVRDNRVRLNHGMGIRTGSGMQVIGNRIVRNGQLGVGGYGDALLIERNQIRANNYAGFDWRWEAGGAKVVVSDGVTFRQNRVTDNDGPGLWTDIDATHVVFESNIVLRNAHAGIMHEISYDATIRRNWVAENGVDFDVWLWGAQILVSTSRNTEIYENTVIVSADGGNAISLIQQDRGYGIRGARRTENNRVHDNTIFYLGERGRTGGVGDYETRAMSEAGNWFDSNTYYGLGLDTGARWAWMDGWSNWQDWQDTGQDVNGSVHPYSACGLIGIEPLFVPLLIRWMRRRRSADRTNRRGVEVPG